MAVAALSTTAPALTATPAAPPQANAASDAPQNFAKLVAQTQPEGRPANGNARPQADAKPSEDAAGEDTPVATSEGTSEETSSDQPIDLLAEIAAMVAAASQLGTGQPVTVSAAPAPVAPSGDATVSIDTSTMATAATPQIAMPAATPIVQPSAEIALTDTAPTDETVVAPPPAATPAQSTPELTQIAGMIAALRQAFGGEDTADQTPPAAAPVENEAEVAIDPETVAPQAIVPQPVEEEETPVVIADADADQSDLAPDKAAPKTRVAHLIEAALAKAAPATQRSEPVIVQPAAPQQAAPIAADHATADAAAPTTDDGSTAATPSAALATPEPATPTVTAAPTTTASTSATLASTAAGGVEGHGIDQTIDRHLDLARDNQWLDRLARDISQAATNPGEMKFKLNPQNLGALTVEIANTAVGTSIRMTTDNEQARAIIADAQPRLIAEVRAQGLRIAETHVDLSNQQNGGSSSGAGAGSAFAQQHQGQQRPSSEDHKPFARTQASVREDVGDSASSDGELYA